MGFQTLNLVLDSPQVGYRPGDYVRGQCVMQLENELPLNKLFIKLKGKARTEWTTERAVSETDSEGKTTTRTETVHHSERHYCMDLLCRPIDGQ